VTVGRQILAIGGFDADETFSVVEARRLTGNGAWRHLEPLPTARANLASAVLDGRVYAIGGYNAADETLAVVETYNPRTCHWTSEHSLPQPRGGAGAAVLDGRLYLAGGRVPTTGTDTLSTNTMIVYDPRTASWRPAAPMTTARERFQLLAAGDHLYAIGGRGEGPSLAGVERYDPRSDSWREINSMHQSRVVPGVVTTTVGRREVIVVIAGAVFSDAGEFVDGRRTTEVLDLATGRWTLLSVQLSTVRGSIGCAVESDGAVLAIAGASHIDRTFVFLADVEALTIDSRDLR